MLHLRKILALFLMALYSVGCSKTKEESAQSRTARPGVVELTAQQLASAKLRTALITSRQASSTLRLPGTLELDPRRSWQVAPVVEGVVEQVAVAAHDAARKGQVLARLRSTALGEAQVAWIEARAKLRIARANRERNLALRKEAVVSEARWLEVDAEFERAQVTLAQADHRLSLAGMSAGQIEALEAAGRRFGELVLTSPADGIVLAATASRGQALAAGENAFEIADLSQLWVTVHVPVASLAQIRRGARATVRVAGSPQSAWDGAIGSLGGTVETADQTVEARVVVTNAGGFLRPGMYAEADVEGAPVEALMVPNDAVFNVGSQAHVFQRLGETSFKALAVTAASPLGGWTPIVGPEVAAGVAVVVDGVAELKSQWLYEGGE